MTVAEPVPTAEGQSDESEKRVAPLELFFDLVFVFAVTQVTALMAHNPTWEGLGQGMLVLIALWWAWGAYAWLTNYIAADEGVERLLIFAVMGAMLIAALAVPHAFGERRAAVRHRVRGGALAAHLHLGRGQRRRGHRAGDRPARPHGAAGAGAADRGRARRRRHRCARLLWIVALSIDFAGPVRLRRAADSACRPATSPSASR